MKDLFCFCVFLESYIAFFYQSIINFSRIKIYFHYGATSYSTSKNCFLCYSSVLDIDNGSDNSMRKYTRVEDVADIEVLEFDGEGLISPSLADKIDTDYCGQHSNLDPAQAELKHIDSHTNE